MLSTAAHSGLNQRTHLATDVLIIGAGPVGLTLALALTREALRVRIVDQASQAKREQRAAVIWPRAAEVLRDLGVIAAFERVANPLYTVAVYANGHRLGALDVGHVPSAFPHPLIVEQQDTERLLAEALAQHGVQVEWKTEALNVQVNDDRATVTLRHGSGRTETATSAWVVGCEGTRSVVREQLGIAFAGRRRENLQVVQVNAVPHWRFPVESTHGYFFLAPRVSVGVYPIPGGGYRFFCFRDDPQPRRREPPTLAEVRELIAAVAHTPELELELVDPPWLNRARFHDRIATSLRRGRALLAGDAAHAWAPIGGHGMNAGIRGAHNLAWKLAAVHRGEADVEVLDTYSDEQRATARAVMAEMRFNVLELPLATPVLRAVQTLLPIGLASHTFRRRVEWTLSDLGMHHRASRLSWQRARRAGLRAGDRAPDAAVIADGRRTTLHALLTHGQWTLVLLTAYADPTVVRQLEAQAQAYQAPIAVSAVVPVDDAAEWALGGSSGMLLVRPDGYIGLVARSGDVGTLAAYLNRFFVRAQVRDSAGSRSTTAKLADRTNA